MEECLALSSVSMHKRKYPILYWKASHCCPMASRDENFLWVSICGGRKTLWSYPHNQRINRRKTIIEYFSLFMVLSPNPPPKLEGLNFLQGIRKMELLGENPVQCCSNRLRDFQFSPRLVADKYKLHFFSALPSFSPTQNPHLLRHPPKISLACQTHITPIFPSPPSLLPKPHGPQKFHQNNDTALWDTLSSTPSVLATRHPSK